MNPESEAIQKALRRKRIREDFDALVNMSSEEMTSHYATPDSEFASLPPALSKRSGRLIGKEHTLPLKRKIETLVEWEDDDYDAAEKVLRPLRLQLSRKMAFTLTDGTPTKYTVALRNRGHDPLKDVVAEGVELTLDRFREIVHNAVRDLFRALFPDEEEYGGPWPWTRDVYPESQRVLVEYDGDLYEMNFERDDRTIICDPSTLKRVELVPIPVAESFDSPRGELLSVKEAEGENGPTWRAVMIHAGEAKNTASNGKRRYYTPAVLEAAVAAGNFSYIPALQRTDGEHQEEAEAIQDGMWQGAVWDPEYPPIEPGGEKGAVVNDFIWKKDRYPSQFDQKIRNALATGKAEDLPNCSITGTVQVNDDAPHIPLRIKELRSCDWISYASAGGTLIAISESHNTIKEKSMKKKILDVLKAKGHTMSQKLQESLKGVEIEAREGAASDYMLAELEKRQPNLFTDKPKLKEALSSDEELLVSMYDLLMASIDTQKPADPAAPATATNPDGTPIQQGTDPKVAEALAGMQAQLHTAMIRAELSAMKLDELTEQMAMNEMQGKPYTTALVNESVAKVKDTIARIRESSRGTRVDVSKDGVDKRLLQIGDVFHYGISDVAARESINKEAGKQIISTHAPRHISFREAYIALTGDVNVDGIVDASISEGLSPSLVLAFVSDVLSKRAALEYNTDDMATSWKKLVPRPKPLANMRSQKITRGGFYGIIQTVNKTTPYVELTQGAEMNNSYTPETKGGLISIHRIDIINDDIGEISVLPQRAGFSAKLALSIDVWTPFTNTSYTLGDSVAFFHSTHANINSGNAATYGLATAGNLQKTLQLLRAQTLPGLTTAKMQMPGKYLIIAEDGTARLNAYAAITPGYGQYNPVPTAEQAQLLELLVCPHADDLDDFFVASDPLRFEFLEVGFLNGRDTPEIFVADTMTAGQMFANDMMQFKVRFDYGVGVVDFRPVAKAAIT